MASVRLNAERAATFDQFWKAMRDQNQLAPSYYIMSGVQYNEGVVIERNAGKTSNNVTWLSQNHESDCKVDQGCIWYIVQTNRDRNMNSYEVRDPRRYQGEQKMNSLKFGASLEEVKRTILETSPNF